MNNSLKYLFQLNLDRLPQTSMIRKVETNEEQNESPLKLEGWLYVNLYRGLINTADRSVRLLKAGDIKEAIKFWERARLFLAELSKRENISDENVCHFNRNNTFLVYNFIFLFFGRELN